MSSKKLRRRREILHALNPRCYWCSRITFLAQIGEFEGKVKPDDMATVDHLYPKYHPLRRLPNSTREERTVLACSKCNHDRDAVDYHSLPDDLRNNFSSRKGSCGPVNYDIFMEYVGNKPYIPPVYYSN